ncbi:hypothetical protein E1286_41060 [Nonomuraea terrae]|uniref:Uncharacterized protein n=1 Tax=Nonomuraea terrae TaxID=2530383 RepID=A0A4R4XS37_9ACTN|nr:hypothetical protein E1286_41060 [Nonomuraea terrae]
MATLGPEEEPTVLRETAGPKATVGQAMPPGGWGEWMKAFDDSLTAQQRMGGIDPRVAGKAREKLWRAARRSGDDRVRQITEVYRDLAKALEKGEMDPFGPAVEFMNDWSLPGR